MTLNRRPVGPQTTQNDRRMLTRWMYIRAGFVVLLVAVLTILAARREEPPVVLESAGEAGTIEGAVTNAVNSRSALALD